MSGRITITEEMRQELLGHKERTAIGSHALLSKQTEPAPVKGAYIEKILGGRIKTVPKDHLEYILKTWEKEPSCIIAEFTPQDEKAGEIKVKVTKAIISSFVQHQERTGIGPYAITKGKRRSKPKGLNGKMFSDILNGKSDYIREDHLCYVLGRYEKMPDKPQTAKELKALRKEAQGRIKPYEFSQGGFATDESHTNHYTYLKYKNSHVKIKKNQRNNLQKYIDQGITPEQVIALNKDISSDITPELVMSWIDGRAQTANRALFERYLKACRSVYNISAKTPRSRWVGKWAIDKKIFDEKYPVETAYKAEPEIKTEGAKAEFKDNPKDDDPQTLVVITHELQTTLKNYCDISGLDGERLLTNAKDLPQGLRGSMINNWISGRFKTARKDHLNFVLKAYEVAL